MRQTSHQNIDKMKQVLYRKLLRVMKEQGLTSCEVAKRAGYAYYAFLYGGNLTMISVSGLVYVLGCLGCEVRAQFQYKQKSPST